MLRALSDYLAFAEARVPVLFLTCGRWEHYHQTSDTPEKLDYSKIVATASYLRDLVEALRVRPEAPVRFLPDGRDDPAHIAMLQDLGALLEPHVPQVALARPVVAGLAAAAAERPLTIGERQTLGSLIMALESVLS